MSATVGYGDILDRWLPAVLTVVNEPQPIVIGGDAVTRLRDALQRVLEGERGPVEAETRWLPRVGVRVEGGRAVRVVEGPSDLSRMEVWDFATQHEDTLQAVVMALAADPLARRLRRCDWKDCEAYFLAKADHRRPHSFCRAAHRRQYDLAHRDPKATAVYMRTYREVAKHPKRRRSKKRRQTR